MRGRGFTLGGTLLMVALVATLGLAVATVCVAHLGLGARSTTESSARDLADSVLACAINRIQVQAEFGTHKEDNLDIGLQDLPGQGLLAFDEEEAKRLGIPVSVNNLAGTESRTAPDGQVVPTQAAYLVAVGRVGKLERRTEVMLHMPPFPYAAASDGPIRSPRGLTVAAVQPGQELDPKNMEPASLRSNATGENSLALGPDSVVTGDAVASGDIELGGAVVRGEVRPNQARQDLPRFEVESFDPETTGLSYVPLDETYPGDELFDGVVRRQGDLNMQGDLLLEDAVVYVDGNMHVKGSMTGSGIVVCTGQVTVDRQVDMTAGDALALVNGGSVKLNGEGKSSSSFQGVIYTEGGLEARQITLRGTLVANRGDRPEGEGISLEQVALLEDDSLSSVEVPTGHQAIWWSWDGQFLDKQPLPLQGVGGGAYKMLVFRKKGGWAVRLRSQVPGLRYTIASAILEKPVRGETGDELAPKLLQMIKDDAALQGQNPKRPVSIQLPDEAELARRLQAIISGSSPEDTGVVVVDPSQMLALPQRLRIVLWREP